MPRTVLGDVRDLGAVGGHDDALDVLGAQRLVDAVLNERLPRVQTHVFARDALGAAARWDRRVDLHRHLRHSEGNKHMEQVKCGVDPRRWAP